MIDFIVIVSVDSWMCVKGLFIITEDSLIVRPSVVWNLFKSNRLSSTPLSQAVLSSQNQCFLWNACCILLTHETFIQSIWWSQFITCITLQHSVLKWHFVPWLIRDSVGFDLKSNFQRNSNLRRNSAKLTIFSSSEDFNGH